MNGMITTGGGWSRPQKMQVEGGKELEKVLRALPKEMAGKQLVAANRAGANVLKRELQDTAPVSNEPHHFSKDGGKDYGKLKDNIKVTVTRTGEHSINMSVHIGAAFWGMFYEFGTSRQPPRPWFRRAHEAKSQDVIITITVNLKTRLEKSALKLAGPYVKSGLSKRRRR